MSTYVLNNHFVTSLEIILEIFTNKKRNKRVKGPLEWNRYMTGLSLHINLWSTAFAAAPVSRNRTQSQISVLWICCGQVASMEAKYNTRSWCVPHMFRLIFLSWLEEPLMEKPSPESVQQLGIWVCEFLNGNGELWRTRIIINSGWTGRGNKVIQANFCSTNTSQCKPERASQSAQRKEAEKTEDSLRTM